MKQFDFIIITKEMIDSANNFVDKVKVNRTIASKIDTLTGILGEFAFAQYMYGDWKKNRISDAIGDWEHDCKSDTFHKCLDLQHYYQCIL